MNHGVCACPKHTQSQKPNFFLISLKNTHRLLINICKQKTDIFLREYNAAVVAYWTTMMIMKTQSLHMNSK